MTHITIEKAKLGRVLEAVMRANELDGMYSWQDEEDQLRQAIAEAEKQQFTTMVEPSIHAGSGEKIGEKHHFHHRGQKQERGEPVGKIVDCDFIGNPLAHFDRPVPIGTILYAYQKPNTLTDEQTRKAIWEAYSASQGIRGEA